LAKKEVSLKVSMAVTKVLRLSKAAREFNVGISTIVEFLHKKGIVIESNPNTKIDMDAYDLLLQEFQSEKNVKEEAKKIGLSYTQHETISIDNKSRPSKEKEDDEQEELFIKGSSVITDSQIPKVDKKEPDAEEKEPEPKPEKEIKEPAKAEKEEENVKEEEVKETPEEETKEEGLKVLGKIDVESFQKKKPAKKTAARKETKTAAEKKKEAEKKAEAKEAPVAEKPALEEKPSEEEKPGKEEKPAAKKPAAKAKKKEPVQKKEEVEAKKEEEVAPSEDAEEIKEDENFIPTRVQKLDGPKIMGKIELPAEPKKSEKKPVASSKDEGVDIRKKKRKRIKKEQTTEESGGRKTGRDRQRGKSRKKDKVKPEVSEEEIQKQIKETLARLAPTGKSKAAKYRRQKREAISQNIEKERQKAEEEKSVLKLTEFVTVNDLANMMSATATEIISSCMQLGLFVSINQRLDAETLTLVAEEFGYQVEFVSVDIAEPAEEEEEEDTTDLAERSPIVTVMGHVDHGKTKLLDYVRNANVVAGEAGGITQHIGAYEVELQNGKRITFLDTPGHEAFTAMRARGAKITDVAIIVIAADDNVMPQTKEAINHAQAAGVPIVFAINKIDKPTANPEKIKEELSKMNILVEDWGGKYQSQDIAAKVGTNVDQLLEKVLLEAELLELKANPTKPAQGTVIESSLDKGRGYVAKLLVQNGTLKKGDLVLAGSFYGRVKAMYNERNQLVKEAGPSAPILLLGLNGAPQAGDTFNIMDDEREVKNIATKRLQLQREQGIRSQKHITLDEIGRRIAIGDFKELNLIVKGDVDGSVEALSDSLLKLSSDEVQVNVIHKSVGQVTESDVLLASASNAIIVGFQVRPSMGARKLAEKEEIEIRTYSIIYQAIEEIKAAIEGMLSPDIEERITCNIEVRETFKISKVGTIAGCMVLDGKVNRNTKVRIIRDGIVVYTGMLGSLKRFKDDVKEVQAGYECGLNIENFNDIKVGDIIEGYEEIEVQRKL
jgi:translation initiation factor IF-2